MEYTSKIQSTDEYLNSLIIALKKIKDCNMMEKSTYNNTEMRVIAEIVSANVQGKRIISTELAKTLGVTRSAVSQMVNRMEEKGNIVRVPAANDRKKVYIELTEKTKELYGKEKSRLCERLDKVLALMGREDMEKLLSLTAKFIDCQERLLKENGEKTEC